MPLAIARDEETSRQIAAGWLLAYLTRMGPLYPRMLSERFGFAHEVEALLAANASGGPPRLPTEAERLAREVIVMGTYDEAPGAFASGSRREPTRSTWCCRLGVPEEQLHEMLEAAAPAATASAGEHRASFDLSARTNSPGLAARRIQSRGGIARGAGRCVLSDAPCAGEQGQLGPGAGDKPPANPAKVAPPGFEPGTSRL